jgi:PAS domain S-box-containing protein
MQNSELRALTAEAQRLRRENRRLRLAHRAGSGIQGNLQRALDENAVLLASLADDVSIDRGPAREQFFETIIENLYDGVAVVSAEGVIRYESPSVKLITGFPPEEVLGRSFLEFIHPDDLEWVQVQMADHLRSPGEWRGAELRFRHASGGWRVLEARAINLVGVPSIDGLVAIYRDVTEQRAAERGRREADERLRELAEKVPGILYQMRLSRDGTILEIPYISEGVRSLLGLDPEAVQRNPQSLIDAIHEEDRPRYAELADDAVAHVRNFKLDVRCTNLEGRIRWMRISSSPRRCENGDLLYSGLAMDVTSERIDNELLQINSVTLEERVRERTAELREANVKLTDEAERRESAETQTRLLEDRVDAAVRLSTTGEMMTGLAHDLHQPLTAIANYAGGCLMRLERHTLDDVEAARVYGEIKDAAMRAAEVVRRAREFTRSRAFNRQPEPINDVCDDALGLGQVSLREQAVKLVRDYGFRLPNVLADRVPIAQVVLNLLSNAASALGDREGERRVILRTARDEHGVRVSVIDNGPGLPEALSEVIFDRFYSTRPDGLGLGLAICRSIVEQHDGKIWVEPSARDGCAFHFTLPAET